MACNVFKSDDKGKQDMTVVTRPLFDYDEAMQGKGLPRSERQIAPLATEMNVRHVRNG